MAQFMYAIVATDGTGYSVGNMDNVSPDEGKPGMAVTGPAGSFGGGYTSVKGDWEPVGLGVIVFDTEEQARAWTQGEKGKAWLADFDSVILARLLA